METNKLKALFMIKVLVFAIFTVNLLVQPVQAQQNQNTVCCELTKSGDYCQQVPESECKQGSLRAATTCDQTSFCKLGCSVSSSEGVCYKNAPRAASEA